MNKYIEYAKVSTTKQDLATQKELLEKEGCEQIFVEKVTGTSTAPRNALKSVQNHVRNGDTVIVTKIDRLARSIIDLNRIVSDLINKGVSVHFINENMTFRTDQHVNSLQTLLFNVLGSFAQFERDLIVERTTEGRERAKQQGKHLGRPAQPQKHIKRALQLRSEEHTSELQSRFDLV